MVTVCIDVIQRATHRNDYDPNTWGSLEAQPKTLHCISKMVARDISIMCLTWLIGRRCVFDWFMIFGSYVFLKFPALWVLPKESTTTNITNPKIKSLLQHWNQAVHCNNIWSIFSRCRSECWIFFFKYCRHARFGYNSEAILNSRSQTPQTLAINKFRICFNIGSKHCIFPAF